MYTVKTYCFVREFELLLECLYLYMKHRTVCRFNGAFKILKYMVVFFSADGDGDTKYQAKNSAAELETTVIILKVGTIEPT